MPFSTYLGNKIVDHMLRNQAFTPPAAIYASIHTGDPGLTGLNEVAGGSYARQAVTLSAAVAKASDNTNLLSYSDMPLADMAYIGLWDAVSAGNYLTGGPLAGGTFSAAASTDTFTATAHGMGDTQKVMFFSRANQTLPTGVSAGTIYYVRDSAANTFKVAATPGGTAIDLTADGAGGFIKVKSTTAGDSFQVAVSDYDITVD